MKVFVVLVSLFVLIAAIPLMADEVFEATSSHRNISKSVSMSISNKVRADVNRTHKRVYDGLNLSGTYEWATDIESTLSLGWVKFFTQEKKVIPQDIQIGIRHSKLYIDEPMGISLYGMGDLFFPLSREERVNRSRLLTINPGFGLSKSILAFSMGYEFSGAYFIHRYRTAKNGSSNAHYGMTNSLLAGYNFTDHVKLQTLWSLVNLATYGKTPEITYSFGQTLSYKVLPSFKVSAGLTTGGKAFKNNGEELNLSLFNVKGTEAILGTEITF